MEIKEIKFWLSECCNEAVRFIGSNAYCIKCHKRCLLKDILKSKWKNEIDL
jgi:hypothetical protein